jgi:hypothetical protein
MVFAVSWVGFYGEFEMGRIVGYDCISDFSIAEFFQLENVGFSADAPGPETVAIAV